MEDKDINILEEFISNYKDIQEKYKDDEIQAEIERSCYFEEVPAIQIEKLLQAYKQDKKVIEEMAKEISKSIIHTCPFEDYDVDLDCENKCQDDCKECWKEYFRKKCE